MQKYGQRQINKQKQHEDIKKKALDKLQKDKEGVLKPSSLPDMDVAMKNGQTDTVTANILGADV